MTLQKMNSSRQLTWQDTSGLYVEERKTPLYSWIRGK